MNNVSETELVNAGFTQSDIDKVTNRQWDLVRDNTYPQYGILTQQLRQNGKAIPKMCLVCEYLGCTRREELMHFHFHFRLLFLFCVWA